MPNNIIAKHQRGNSEFVKNLPIVDGQKVYNTETGEEFLDIGKERVLRHKDIRKLVADIPGIHDDKVSKEELWSSDKTASELGKGLYREVGPLTGGFITIPNAAGSMPIRAVTEIPVVQEGSGDPSPENVRPIVMHDKVELTRCGKNLLDMSKAVNNAYNIGGMPICIKPGVIYTLSIIDAVGGARFRVYLGKSSLSGDLEISSSYIGNGEKTTFTCKDYDISYKYIILAGNKSGAAVDNINQAKFQIEVGSESTPYEPHISSTYTAHLPEPVAGGVVDWESTKSNPCYVLFEFPVPKGPDEQEIEFDNVPGLKEVIGEGVNGKLQGVIGNCKNRIYANTVGVNSKLYYTGVTIGEIKGKGPDFRMQYAIPYKPDLLPEPVSVALSASPTSIDGENNIFSNVGVNTITAYEKVPSDFIRDYVVDLTCEKFEQKGLVVTCYPVPDHHLNVISEIVGEHTSAELTLFGKNWVSNDHIIRTEGHIDIFKTKPAVVISGKDYTISLNDIVSRIEIVGVSVNGSIAPKGMSAENTKAITYTPDINGGIRIIISDPNVDKISKIQMENGSVSTSYEPYIGKKYITEIPSDTTSLDWGNWVYVNRSGTHPMDGEKPKINSINGENNLFTYEGITTVSGRKKASEDRNNYTNQVSANALTCSVHGKSIELNDVSPLTHNISCKVSGVQDLSSVVITRCGKNRVDPRTVERRSDNRIDIFRQYPTYVEQGKQYTISINQIASKIEVVGVGGSYGISPNGFASINSKTAVYTPNINGYIRIVILVDKASSVTEIQMENGGSPTEYAPYYANKYHPDVDGNVYEIKSISPEMTITSDSVGSDISVVYNRDTKQAIDGLSSDVHTITKFISDGKILRSSTITSCSHRGLYGKGVGAMNCKSAYIAARRAGYYAAENDTALTKDGVFVMWHDPTLGRLGELRDITGKLFYLDSNNQDYWYDNKNQIVYVYDYSSNEYRTSQVSIDTLVKANGSELSIERMNYNVLKRLDFGYYLGFPGESILTFEEWVKLCHIIGLNLYVDWKMTPNSKQVKELVEIVQRNGMLKNTTWLSYYELVRPYDPHARCGVFSKPSLETIEKLKPFNLPDAELFYNCNGKDLTRDQVALALDNGFRIECWFVDYEKMTENQIFDRIMELMDMGVQGFSLDKYRVEDVIESRFDI